MKLYYTPGACSLAPHIIAREAGLTLNLEQVDLRSKRTEAGRDYRKINPVGSVPALELEDGAVITENAVVLQYLAEQAPELHLGPPREGLERWRMLETINFIATELHKGFGPMFQKPSDAQRDATLKHVASRFDILQDKLGDQLFLTGDRFTIADAYAFVTLNWANQFKLDLKRWPKLKAYYQRIAERPRVRQALGEEGLQAAA